MPAPLRQARPCALLYLPRPTAPWAAMPRARATNALHCEHLCAFVLRNANNIEFASTGLPSNKKPTNGTASAAASLRNCASCRNSFNYVTARSSCASNSFNYVTDRSSCDGNSFNSVTTRSACDGIRVNSVTARSRGDTCYSLG